MLSFRFLLLTLHTLTSSSPIALAVLLDSTEVGRVDSCFPAVDVSVLTKIEHP